MFTPITQRLTRGLGKPLVLCQLIILLFSLFSSAILLSEHDKLQPFGTAAAVHVQSFDTSHTDDEILSTIINFSHDNKVGILVNLPDIQDPLYSRDLYVEPANNDSEFNSWLEHGYPGFSPEIVTRVHPLAELANKDPRAMYELTSSGPVVEKFQGLISSLGGQTLKMTNLSGLIFLNSSIFSTFLFVGCIVLILTVAGVILGCRNYAIKQLLGISLPKILGRDLLGIFHCFYPLASLCIAVCGLGLYFYNGFSGFSRFFLLTLGLWSGYFIVALVTHIVALAFISSVNIVKGIKGWAPARGLTSLSYLARVPVVILLLGVFAVGSNQFHTVSAAFTGQQAWKEHSSEQVISLSASRNPSEYSDLASQLGKQLRNVDSNNRAITITRWDYNTTGTATSDDGFKVNSSFIKNNITPDLGISLPEVGSNKILLVLPEHKVEQHESIINKALSDLNRLNSSVPTDTVFELDTVIIDHPYQAFTYDQLDNSTVLDDPILFIHSNGSSLLSDRDYGAYASNGSYKFIDKADVDSLRKTPEFSSFIYSSISAQDKWLSRVNSVRKEFSVSVINIALGLFIMLTLIVISTRIYMLKNRQRLFAQFLYGVSTLKIFKTLFISELLLGAVPLLWLGKRYYEYRLMLSSSLVFPPWRLLMVSTTPPIIVFAISITLVGLIVTGSYLSWRGEQVIKENQH